MYVRSRTFLLSSSYLDCGGSGSGSGRGGGGGAAVLLPTPQSQSFSSFEYNIRTNDPTYQPLPLPPPPPLPPPHPSSALCVSFSCAGDVYIPVTAAAVRPLYPPRHCFTSFVLLFLSTLSAAAIHHHPWRSLLVMIIILNVVVPYYTYCHCDGEKDEKRGKLLCCAVLCSLAGWLAE